MFLHTQCNEKWQSFGCSKGLHKARRITRMIMTRHRTKREGHWWDQHRKRAGVARSYMVRVYAVENKLRNRVTTTGKAKASWVRRQGWRRKLVIICHTTDIVCSFHCQIIDCYDLNEWLTIVWYNRFSPNAYGDGCGGIKHKQNNKGPSQFKFAEVRWNEQNSCGRVGFLKNRTLGF